MNKRRFNDKSAQSDFDFTRIGYEKGQGHSSNFQSTPDSNYRLAPFERRGGPHFENKPLVENRNRQQVDQEEDHFRYSQSGDYGSGNRDEGDHYKDRRDIGFIESLKNSVKRYFGKGPRGR